MRFPFAIPVLMALTVSLSGCADLFGVLGIMGATVSGQVRIPERQRDLIGGLDAYRTSAHFPGEVSVGAHAEVQSFTLQGLPVANATTRTDATGNFRLDGVPADRVSILRASVKGKNGKTLRLAALVKASGGATVTELSAVSTLVAEGLLRVVGTDGIGRMSQDQITELEHVVMQAATEADRQVDLSGADAPATRFQALVGQDPEVAAWLARLQDGGSRSAWRRVDAPTVI